MSDKKVVLRSRPGESEIPYNLRQKPARYIKKRMTINAPVSRAPEPATNVPQHSSQQIQAQAPSEILLRQEQLAMGSALENAKKHYEKKEFNQAFNEWEQICLNLDHSSEFSKNIQTLKATHENLGKASEELTEVRKVLSRRMDSSYDENKFIQDANEVVSAQVRNIYSTMGNELRVERVPKTLSFWWPVILSVAVVGVGFTGLKILEMRLTKQAKSAQRIAYVAPPADVIQEAYLEAQKNEYNVTVEKLRAEQAAVITSLKKSQEELDSKDKEGLAQLDANLKELESENTDLKRQIEILLADQKNRDIALANLQ